MTARDAEDDLPPELAAAVFRVVQEYMAGLAEGEAESAGRRVSEAMGLEAAVAAAVHKLREEGWVKVGGHAIVGPHTAVGARHVLGADTITLSESSAILPLEGISVLVDKASRKGIAGLSRLQVFTLVLVWLVAVGVPVVQQALPPEAQTILSNDYGTISLAIAITAVILGRRKA